MKRYPGGIVSGSTVPRFNVTNRAYVEAGARQQPDRQCARVFLDAVKRVNSSNDAGATMAFRTLMNAFNYLHVGDIKAPRGVAHLWANWPVEDCVEPGLDEPNPAQKYGSFRIAYRDVEGEVHRQGEGRDWNEGQATKFAGQLQDRHPVCDVWIEHQNTATGEWRRW